MGQGPSASVAVSTQPTLQNTKQTLPPTYPRSNSVSKPLPTTATNTNITYPSQMQIKSSQRQVVSAPSTPSQTTNSSVIIYSTTTSHSSSSSQRHQKSEESPFQISCPYYGCTRKIEAKHFYGHALTKHKNEVQNYSCPICPLLGYGVFKPNSSTNLLSHLQKYHGDLVSLHNPSTFKDPVEGAEEFDFSAIEDNQDIPQEVLLDSSKFSVGSKYVEEILKVKREDECGICYEDFRVGDTVARLDCFCIYHKRCIDAWFVRGNKCPVHKE